jgi:hypothetical protein
MVKRSLSSPCEAKRPCGVTYAEYESMPRVQDVVESTQLVEYPCFTALPVQDETPLEFRIDKTDAYTDLSQSFICLKAQILKDDGTKLGTKDIVSTVNNAFYSLFQDVQLILNDNKLTESDGGNYPYWNYLKNLLYTTPDEKKTILQGACWSPDDAGLFDRITGPVKKDAKGKVIPQIKNSGFEYRGEVFGDSKLVTLYARLSLNVIFDRLLPPQTEITLRFIRKPVTFTLLAAKDSSFKLKIHDAKLHASRVQLKGSQNLLYNRMLSSKGFSYPALGISTRTKTVSVGDQNFEWIPFRGELPRRLYFFQTSQDAFNNKIELNPFNFQPFHISNFQIFRNELSVPLMQGFTDVSGSGLMPTYIQTYCSVNSQAFPIRYADYSLGYMIFAVDLTNDRSSGCGYDNPRIDGALRLIVDYSEPLKKPITIFCVGEFNSNFKIDANRNIIWQN